MSLAAGRGNDGDPEKDPALFPESRVRPWAVDEKAERQMGDMVDNFEKTLMLVSPVKEGLGLSVLDRSCGDDDRGDIFFSELAALQAKKEAEAARGASGCCGSLSIGEVFEDLYRETHGLPPRKKNPSTTRGSSIITTTSSSSSSIVDTEPSDDDKGVVPGGAAGGDTYGCANEETAAGEGEEGRLVDDGDVARLLAELQAGFDTDGSDLEAGEPSVDGEPLEVATGEDHERASAPADGSIDCAESRSHNRYGETLRKLGVLEAADISSSPSCQPDGAKQDGNEPGVARSGRTPPEEDRPAEVDGSQRTAESNEVCSTQRRVDISRMKIDAPERGARAGPRPQSAPSACLSSGKFSRLSRASSSHLARTVSQKLLQATKEAVERASSEAQQGGDTRHRAPGSARARADDASYAARKRGAASQASTPVRRTSYLRRRQPRAPRWAPRDGGVWLEKPLSKRGAEIQPGTGQTPVRQRPHTAMNRRRASAEELEPPSFTPLLSGPEVEFLFGKADHGTDTAQQPSPSLRKTTLGRLLRRTASSNIEGHRKRRGSEHGSGSPYFRRPSSAESSVLCGSGGKRERCEFKPAWDALSVGQKKMAPRPSSAVTSGVRGRRPSPAICGSLARSSAVPGGEKRQADCRVARTSPKETAEPRDKDTASVANSPARNHFSSGGNDTGPMPLESVKARERGGRSAVSLKQALDATLEEVIGTVSPLEQFVNARKTVAEMKQINTKDSTGDILLSTQGMPKERIKEECWSSESHRQYR